MYLVIYLSDPLELGLAAVDSGRIQKGDSIFEDICPAWEKSMFLGFYDWLRAEGGDIIGVNLTLHDGRDELRAILPARSYLEWLSPDVLRVFFGEGLIDERLSVDQEFSPSRCLRAEDGSVALLFDASDIPSVQADRLTHPQRDVGAPRNGDGRL